MPPETQRFYGKYRGVCINNLDPERRGRIQAMVPDVTGSIPTSWALPCVPVAGPGMGFYAVPPMNASVWIEFEGGNPDHPIWSGGFWDSMAEVPALAQAVLPGTAAFVLQTTATNALVISDMPGPTGCVMIQLVSGATVMINVINIVINNGKGAVITMTGNMVDVNTGALTVM